jgi:hypothetical protein
LPERDYAYILDHMLRGATIKKAKASSGASKDDVQFTGRTYKKLNGWRRAEHNIYGAGKIYIPHTGKVEDRIIFLPGSVDGDKIVPMEHEMGDIEKHFVDLSTNNSDTLAMIVKKYSGFNMYKISRSKPAHATRNSVAVDIKTTTCLDKINKKVDVLEAKVDHINDKVADHDREIVSLNDRVSSLESAVSVLHEPEPRDLVFHSDFTDRPSTSSTDIYHEVVQQTPYYHDQCYHADNNYGCDNIQTFTDMDTGDSIRIANSFACIANKDEDILTVAMSCIGNVDFNNTIVIPTPDMGPIVSIKQALPPKEVQQIPVVFDSNIPAICSTVVVVIPEQSIVAPTPAPIVSSNVIPTLGFGSEFNFEMNPKSCEVDMSSTDVNAADDVYSKPIQTPDIRVTRDEATTDPLFESQPVEIDSEDWSTNSKLENMFRLLCDDLPPPTGFCDRIIVADVPTIDPTPVDEDNAVIVVAPTMGEHFAKLVEIVDAFPSPHGPTDTPAIDPSYDVETEMVLTGDAFPSPHGPTDTPVDPSSDVDTEMVLTGDASPHGQTYTPVDPSYDEETDVETDVDITYYVEKSGTSVVSRPDNNPSTYEKRWLQDCMHNLPMVRVAALCCKLDKCSMDMVEHLIMYNNYVTVDEDGNDVDSEFNLASTARLDYIQSLTSVATANYNDDDHDHYYSISSKGGYMVASLIYYLYRSSIRLLSDGSLDVAKTDWLCTSQNMTIESIEDAIILVKCKYTTLVHSNTLLLYILIL